MGEAWKSFWMGAIAMAVIAIVAGVVLSSANPDSSETFSSSSVRL